MLYLTVVSICISLMTNDAEQLFMCCWPLCISLEKVPFKYFAHFFFKQLNNNPQPSDQLHFCFFKSKLSVLQLEASQVYAPKFFAILIYSKLI